MDFISKNEMKMNHENKSVRHTQKNMNENETRTNIYKM